LFGRPLGPSDAAVGTPSTPGGGAGRESGWGGDMHSHSQSFVSALNKTGTPLRTRTRARGYMHTHASGAHKHTHTHMHARARAHTHTHTALRGYTHPQNGIRHHRHPPPLALPPPYLARTLLVSAFPHPCLSNPRPPSSKSLPPLPAHCLPLLLGDQVQMQCSNMRHRCLACCWASLVAFSSWPLAAGTQQNSKVSALVYLS
jgi:hypothetical protein